MTENLRNGSVVKTIESYATELKKKALEIEQLEIKISELKSQKKELEEVTIPSVMMEAGVQELTLMSGDTVEVKPFYYARLFKESGEPFFAWLRENGFGPLIKDQISIQPSAEEMQLVLDFLAEFKIYYEQGSTIHWKTLEAWFKECMEAGVKLPLHLFQNYCGNKAKVKAAK